MSIDATTAVSRHSVGVASTQRPKTMNQMFCRFSSRNELVTPTESERRFVLKHL